MRTIDRRNWSYVEGSGHQRIVRPSVRTRSHAIVAVFLRQTIIPPDPARRAAEHPA